jgi:flagellar export protein FliJ
MSSLDSLIRLHRWQLDEQRRRVAELETLAAKLRAELRRLDDDHVAEQRIAGNSLEAAYTYTGYAQAVMERRGKLAASLANTEQETLAARQVLGEAFQEVKRYETAAANRLLSQHRQLQRLEQRDMDELGTQVHRRKTARLD